MKRLAAIAPVLLLAVAPAVMLQTLWTNPTSAGEDDVIYYYPLRKLAGQALREGRWPLVNPYEAGGSPLLADPQAAVLYPPTWLFAALDAPRAYALSVMAGFALAGIGTWLYLRRLGLVRPAAGFGALAFMFCGFLVGHRVHLAMLHAAAWLPWGLWGIERLPRRPLAAAATLTAVAFLALAAGHWPILVYMLLVWAAYLLFRARPLPRSLAVAAAALALAALLAAPQLQATARLLAAATRNRIGYATAGENSFFPASAILALYPMILGCRTPNFFPNDWWGPWHLCETLGYVGLVTLVLAAAAGWTLLRRPAASARPDPFGPLARTWAWIALAAGVWMLGYYLPTYRLVHMLPVLRIVRCPARMLLAVDMALATLAAVAVHRVLAGPAGPDAAGSAANLPRCIDRAATWGLPAAMVAALLALAAAGAVSVAFFGGRIAFFDRPDAGYRALAAVLPTNPAVYVQLALAVATVAVARTWLKAPRRRWPLLIALLTVDLFFVTRFVDVPAGNRRLNDPDNSPAARWLARHAPRRDEYLVWGIGRTYHDRAAELLRPKTAHALGFGTINTYGPFQSPAHAHLLGFRIFGTNRDWPRLLRRNRLLSALGVRYILTARPDVREVLESVRVPTDPPPRPGPNLLTGPWWLDLAEVRGGTLHLRTPVLWRWSIAKQPVTVEPETVYRIELDARGPDGGAANFLRAEIYRHGWALSYEQSEPLGLTAHAEQIGTDWRHFEWTFRTPHDVGGEVLFRLFTMSERPIEVRNVRFRRAAFERPLGVAGRLPPGAGVYALRAVLPALGAGDRPVAIYENLLARRRPNHHAAPPPTPAEIERLKWDRSDRPVAPGELPALGLAVREDPTGLLLRATLPAAAGWVLLAAGAALRSRRRDSPRPAGAGSGHRPPR